MTRVSLLSRTKAPFFLVPAAALALLACASEAPEDAPLAQSTEAATLGGQCVQPTLDFEELGRWQLVSGSAPTADASGKSGKGFRVAASTHTIRATLNPLTSSWTNNMTLALRSASQTATGHVTATLTTASGTSIAFPRTSFSATTSDWTSFSVAIPSTAAQAALAAQATPVTITLKFETNRILRVDELRFGHLLCGRCNPALPAEDASEVAPPTLPGDSTPIDVAFRIPQGLSMGSIALGASGQLEIGSSARVLGMATGSFGTVTNVGTTLTRVLGFATVGDTQSVPDIVLAGTISGSVVRQQNVILQGSGKVTGTVTHRDIPVQEMRWTAHLPNVDPTTTLTVPAGQTKELLLRTGTVDVTGTLTVKPGAYVVSTLKQWQPGIINVDNAGGDVFIYVLSALDLRGTLNLTDPNRNNVVLVYLGTAPTIITSLKYTGIVIAPNADVEFDRGNGQFAGSVFARNIELNPSNTFRYQHYYPLCQSDAIHVCGTSKPGCVELKGCEALACQPGPEHAAAPSNCYRTEDEPVWGFADLHAHPASELGFGYDGGPGMFVGSTGLDLNEDFPVLECAVDKHAGFTTDFVNHEIRKGLVSRVEGAAGFAHTPHGTGGIGSWPSARSVLHQQMRVDWIRRAFDGGQRLMFAAVTDNRMLDHLWHFGWGGGSTVADESPTNAQWDTEHAERQLDHIENVVEANSSWMQIVDGPAAAREAIRNGKLAVVLSLEMDSLDLPSILDLKSRHKIGHVIPIHLADNSWGGTAVYDELFEANSWFLNRGTRIALEHSPAHTFHLPVRTGLSLGVAPVPAPFPIPAPAITIAPSTEPLYAADACNTQRHGHKNALGLTGQGKQSIEALMAEGLIVDVSHMGDRSTEDTIALLTSAKFRYPVMSSHTGIQSHEGPLGQADKGARGPMLRERELTQDQARRIGQSGGVIGLGTAGDVTERVLADVTGGELVNLGPPETPQWNWELRDRRLFSESALVNKLDLRLHAAYDGKRLCNDVQVQVLRRSGSPILANTLGDKEVAPHAWTPNVRIDLPSMPLSDIVGIQLDYRANEQCATGDPPDEFAVDGIRATFATTTGERGTLLQRSASVESQGGRNGYYFLFKPGNTRLLEKLRWSADERFLSEEIRALRVRYAFTTGFSFETGRAKFVIGTSDPCFSPEITTPIVPQVPPAPNLNNEGSFDFTSSRQSNGSPYTVADVLSVSLVETAANIEILTLEVETPSGIYELATHRGRPFVASTRKNIVLYEPADECRRLSLDDPARTVLVHLTTGDDRPNGTDPLYVRICKPDIYCAVTPVNPSAPWDGDFLQPGGTVTVALQMPDDFKVKDLYSLDIQSTTGWDIDRVRVTIPDDPLERFVEHYRGAAGLMNGRGIALGTDLNGFQHQLAFSGYGPGYPFAVPGPSGATAATLPANVIGDRVLDFERDGLAHYGMLADMVATLRNVPGGQDTYGRLFRSAEDVIRMWERIAERKLVFDARRLTPCVAFGPANQVKSALGVSCLSLAVNSGLLLPRIQVVSDPSGTLAGDGYLDVYASNCVMSRIPVRIHELNQWVPVPMLATPGCPVQLRMQGEPGDSYGVMYQPM
jgi:microsomal dipeptidase-like Zn-dependent dipeptidase